MDHLYIRIRKYKGEKGNYYVSYFEPSRDSNINPEMVLWKEGKELSQEQVENFTCKETIDRTVKEFFDDYSAKEQDSIMVPDTFLVFGSGKEASNLQKIINYHLESTKTQKEFQYDKD